MPKLFIPSRLLLLQPHCRTAAGWHAHYYCFITPVVMPINHNVYNISAYIHKNMDRHTICNIGDINVSALAAPAGLAAVMICFVIAFLNLSMIKTPFPFARTNLLHSTMTPQHGLLICADKTMLLVILSPVVHRCAHPGCIGVLS